ncbi:MAG: serine/threonine-protein kinase, partial [Thermoguttaceae bacterium]|nr:serine/threonine-protein kinase [Thermoguttaceae bacterium]
MPKLTTDEFLDYLRRSDLVPSEQLDTAIDHIRQDENTERIKDADSVALELVNKGLITNWHVRQLMKRKYKGFYLRKYRILGHLGTGGMSTVYLAEHTVMHRRVAIKVLPKKKLANSAYLIHFVQEAQAIATLDHPNIVRAYDIDQLDDIHYIVMEYFEGVNLKQLVEKEGPLAYEDAVVYVRQAALGLMHAHRVGVFHRDIKPENLLVNDLGILKILDLGLAMLDEAALPQMTQSAVDEGKIIGTADYLAPEQAINSSKIDGRADIYSLGATLYFCLTGHPPFPFGTISQRLMAHQKETPASIFKDRPDAPDDLVRICTHMMEKKPENRFRSAAEVVRVCERWLIHHGVAEENDFPDSNTEGSDLFTKSDLNSTPLFSLAQYGNVTGITDDATVESVKTPRKTGANEIDLGTGARVNLLGSQESSVAENIF